jgi:uncharacterized protein (TIGR03437 family)
VNRLPVPLLLVLFGSLASAQYTIINTVAGTGPSGPDGDNGLATQAELYTPSDVVVDSSGNLYIADTQNNRIRKVNTAGIITTVAGGACCGFGGDGGPATSATLNQPTGVAVDSSGNVYIADTDNQVIRKVSGGTITTIAGTPGTGGFSGDGGPAASAMLFYPHAVAVDNSGNVFIADTQNDVIRKIDAATGIISTVAGTGKRGYSGDGGPATTAALCSVGSVALDTSGNIFFPDGCQRIREVSAATGNITTIAGNGTAGYAGDGGAATSAQLFDPNGVAVNASGDVFIADTHFSIIRKVSNGIMTTVAGDGGAGYYGDGGAATLASIYNPLGVAADNSGNFFIADTGNNRIREVSPSASLPTTISPEGIVPVFSSVAVVEPGEWISIFGTALGPTTPVLWNGDFPTELGGTSVTIDGVSAYLWYVSFYQINLQVPDLPVGGNAPVTVFAGDHNATAFVPVTPFAPSFSLLGDNKHVAGIIVRPDGSGAYGGGTYDILGPTGISLGYSTVAAKAGDHIELYGVGFGSTTPSVPPGQVLPAGPAPQTDNPVTLSINNNTVAADFAGLSEAGLYQINVTVPAGLGMGDLPLLANVSFAQTQLGVVIPLQ